MNFCIDELNGALSVSCLFVVLRKIDLFLFSMKTYQVLTPKQLIILDRFHSITTCCFKSKKWVDNEREWHPSRLHDILNIFKILQHRFSYVRNFWRGGWSPPVPSPKSATGTKYSMKENEWGHITNDRITIQWKW